MSVKNICVIGLGYIGLPTATLLATNGYSVIGVDNNADVVKKINSGECHIFEKGLNAKVKDSINSGRLRATLKPHEADVFIICVPTPVVIVDGEKQPDIQHVIDATDSLAGVLRSGNLVILESTSPVGTTEKIFEILRKRRPNADDFHCAYCPERVLPGKIMEELIHNDRIVGGVDEASTKYACEFYKSFVKGKIFPSDAKTAEMSKLVENSYRDVNIAFANEISIICDDNGIDVLSLLKLVNRHPRVNVLEPGSGVGGHCIAVDPWFLVSQNRDNAKIIKKAREVNECKTSWVLQKVIDEYEKRTIKNTEKNCVICLGLAFKPDVDDLRESPSLDIALRLQNAGIEVLAVEPHIAHHASVKLISIADALKLDGIFVALVKHSTFCTPEVFRQLEKKNMLNFGGLASHDD